MNLKALSWRDINNNTFWAEIFYFTLTQFLSVVILLSYYSREKIVIQSTPQDIIYHPIFFVVLFLLISFVVFQLLKRAKSTVYLRIIFIIALTQGLYITYGSFFDQPAIHLVVFGLLFMYFFVHTILVHNFILVFALSGIGLILGLKFNTTSAILVLIALAVYDYISVYKTKHMISMFKKMVHDKVMFALILPYDRSEYRSSARLVEINERYMFLGSGDLILPIILLVPATIQGYVHGLGVFVGSLVGLIALYIQFITRESRSPMAGLPPIVGGAIVGYLITLL